MRLLVDYRPALRHRTGVGEFVHELVGALARSREAGEHLAILTASWKDRPRAALAEELPGVSVIDRRLPVRGLTWAWNRLGWPPVEWLAGAADVVHAQTPLLIPSREAAGLVTIHDLDFLRHPERAEAEMRRDFPALVRRHALRADHVMVSSQYAAGQVATLLGVARDRITVCSPGAPAWASRVAEARAAGAPQTSILFLGTIEPRKNIGVLLDAYGRLRARRPDAPPLVLAGRVRGSVQRTLDAAIGAAPLAGHVMVPGYVPDAARPDYFRAARLLVLPSLEEGFGLPVLEAMACGVPVVISNRGSLPEVAGDAATPVAATDPDALSREMERLLEPGAAEHAAARGRARAARYSWTAAAAAARDAYRLALARRADRRV